MDHSALLSHTLKGDERERQQRRSVTRGVELHHATRDTRELILDAAKFGCYPPHDRVRPSGESCLGDAHWKAG